MMSPIIIVRAATTKQTDTVKKRLLNGDKQNDVNKKFWSKKCPVWTLGIHVQIFPKNVSCRVYEKKQRFFEWHATFLLLAWDAKDFLPGFHSSPGISKTLEVTGTSENTKRDSFSGFLKFISTRYLHHNKTTGLFQSIILQPHFAGWCLSLEANPQKGTYNNSNKPRKAYIFPPAPIRHIGSVPALDSPLQAIRSPLPVLQKICAQEFMNQILKQNEHYINPGFPGLFFIAPH